MTAKSVVSPPPEDAEEWSTLLLGCLGAIPENQNDSSLEALAASLYCESELISLEQFLAAIREHGNVPPDYTRTVSPMDPREILAAILSVTSFPRPLCCETAACFVDLLRRAFKQLVVATAHRRATQHASAPRNGVTHGDLHTEVGSLMSTWAMDVCVKLETELFPLLWNADTAVSGFTTGIEEEEGSDTPAGMNRGPVEGTLHAPSEDSRAPHWESCYRFFSVTLLLLEDMFTVTGDCEVEHVLVSLYGTSVAAMGEHGSAESREADEGRANRKTPRFAEPPMKERILARCAHAAVSFLMDRLHCDGRQSLVTILARHWRVLLLQKTGFHAEDSDVERGLPQSNEKALVIYQQRQAAVDQVSLFPMHTSEEMAPTEQETNAGLAHQAATNRFRGVGAALMLTRTLLGCGSSDGADMAQRLTLQWNGEALFWQTVCPFTDALEVSAPGVQHEAIRSLFVLLQSLDDGTLAVRAETDAVSTTASSSWGDFRRAQGSRSFRTHAYGTVFNLVKQLVTVSSVCPQQHMRQRAQATVELVLSRCEEALRVHISGSLLVLCPFPSVARFLLSSLAKELNDYNAHRHAAWTSSSLYEQHLPRILAEALQAHAQQIEMAQLGFVDCVIAELNVIRVLVACERRLASSDRLQFTQEGKLRCPRIEQSSSCTDVASVHSWADLVVWVKFSISPRLHRLLNASTEHDRPTPAGVTTGSFTPLHLSAIDTFSLSMAMEGLEAFY